MFNNQYARGYMQPGYEQNVYDQIDNQIRQLQQMKDQIKQQPTAINQTFQLAPSNNHSMKFANTIDEVNKEVVYSDTPYFAKDMSVLWVKKATGETKTYELKELVYQDEKDAKIEFLMAKINKLENDLKAKEEVYNAKSHNEYVDEQLEDEKPSSIPTVRTTKKK